MYLYAYRTVVFVAAWRRIEDRAFRIEAKPSGRGRWRWGWQATHSPFCCQADACKSRRPKRAPSGQINRSLHDNERLKLSVTKLSKTHSQAQGKGRKDLQSGFRRERPYFIVSCPGEARTGTYLKYSFRSRCSAMQCLALASC
jgi:hypothetical protein